MPTTHPRRGCSVRLITSPTAVLAALLWTTASLAAPTTSNVEPAPTKDPGSLSIPDPIHIDVGGDTIGSATVIPGLPYSDSGNTCGYVDNYAPNCGFAGGAPDVVYAFSPGANINVDIQLCGSSYDTELYVLENGVANQIACNDDYCGLSSALFNVALTAGNTYYIVVDGYSANCGSYVIDIAENVPCIVDCPPGALAEGEADCVNDVLDFYNAGCNTSPPAFTDLPCTPGGNVTVCGTYGGFTYTGLSYRDTDWYQINLSAPTAITWCVAGEYDTLIGIIDGNLGCPVTAFYDSAVNGPCVPGCVSQVLGPGTWWLFVATSGFGPAAGACGGNYTATLSGYQCGPVSVEPMTWGEIKGDYR